MNRNLPSRLLPALALVFAVSSCLAQTLYLLPEPARPAPGDGIRVQLMRGVPFSPSATADRVPETRLGRLWRSGRQQLKSEGAADPIFSATESGVQLLSYRKVVEGQTVESFGKALLVVGEGESGGRVWSSELGHRLEMIPETDPAIVAEQGGPFELQILLDREPLAGAMVVALAEGAVDATYRQALTDTEGRVRFDLARPGRWLIHLAHKSRGAPAEGESQPRWILLQSSLTLLAGPQ